MCQTGFRLGVPRFGHSTRNICEKINCEKVENEYVPFSANPAFYAFCSVSNCNVKEIFMYKCDNEETHIFDSKSRSCVYNCKSAGYFPDSNDCSIYYICNGKRTFVSQQVNCPVGYYFNGTACVNSTKHCPLESTITTEMPSLTETSNPAESFTHVQTVGTTEITTESSLIALISDSSTQSPTVLPSTDPTPPSVTEASSLPSFTASYPNIFFLPCPLYLTLSNDQICSQVGSYLNYGKKDEINKK